MPPPDDCSPLLLSVDFEDWHQLARRRIGLGDWERADAALPRQTERLLGLLDGLGIRATFFVLGMAARAYPDLVERLGESGHEVGCHGDAHIPVHSQSPHEFAADLRAARATIEQLTGRRPLGYRAPAFSITRQTPWAYEVLVEEGFAYDASQHDSPLARQRVVPAAHEPHPIALSGGTLWEFPIAVWRTRGISLPVGGASYWAAVPTALVLKGLAAAGALAGLYLHPYEFDPDPLSLELPPSVGVSQRARGLLRQRQRNVARSRATHVLEAVAQRHRLIPYGEAHVQLSARAAAST